MRPSMKFAWINLLILAVLMIYYTAQFIILGKLGMNPGILALFITGLVVVKMSRDKIPFDERDSEIERQGTLAGLWTVYAYFFAAGMMVTFDFEKKPIAHQTFINFYCIGFLIFIAVASLVMLVLYGMEREKAGGILDKIREMNAQQREAAIALLIILPLFAVALFYFPLNGSTPVDIGMSFALMLVPIASFLLFPFFMVATGREKHDRAIVISARKFKYLGAMVTGIAGLLAIVVLYLVEGTGAVRPNHFALVGFLAFSVGTIGCFVRMIFGFLGPATSHNGLEVEL